MKMPIVFVKWIHSFKYANRAHKHGLYLFI